jgi:hypothetical protein
MAADEARAAGDESGKQGFHRGERRERRERREKTKRNNVTNTGDSSSWIALILLPWVS